MIPYIIKSSLSLILLFGLYWFLLRKEKLFVFNRFFLIASVVFSLVVPFISVHVNLGSNPVLENLIPAQNYFNPKTIAPEIKIPEVLSPSPQQNITNLAPEIRIATVLLGLYLSVLVLFLARFLRNIYLIFKKTRSHEKIDLEKYKIVLTSDKSGPCCFFDYIFLNREDYLNGRIDKELLDHEIQHASQSHTIDIMLIEMVKIIYWFNPIHLLYERAIRINHEYLADNGVININPDIKNYSDKLLGFINCNSNMSLTSGSNNSFTKMRLLMMFKARSGRYLNLARITGTLCIVTVFFMLLSFKKSEEKSLQPAFTGTSMKLQQNSVRGKVLGPGGAPVKDATIVCKSQKNSASGTTTDASGVFALDGVLPEDSLVIGCFGYNTLILKPEFTYEMKINLIKIPDFPEITEIYFRHTDFTPSDAVISINGVILDRKSNLRISPAEIETFEILKDKEAISRYGSKGKEGVLEIVLYNHHSASSGSKKVLPDSSKYITLFSVNNKSNKGELIEIPVQNLQSVGSWKYPNPKSYPSLSRQLRSIAIMTRDFYRIKGIVEDRDGRPLPGVSVSVTDMESREVSDKNGRFIMEDVRDNGMLGFSLPGYKPYYLVISDAVFSEDLKIEMARETAREKEKVYETADKMPQYPGGDMELFKFLAGNAIYPEAARAARAQGRITIRFIINSKGNVEKPEVIERVHPALDSVALRAVSMLKGFAPATIGGKPVSVYYSMPITFMLPPDKTENK
jgi:TonB family protein